MIFVNIVNMLRREEFILIYTALLLGVSSYFDIRFRKIPNKCLAFFTVSGLILRGPRFAMILILSISALFILFLFRLFGAGDLKLTALMTAFLGIKNSAAVCIISLCISAMYSVIILLKKKLLINRIIYFIRFVDISLNTMTIKRYCDKADEKDICMLMAHWFLLGFIIWRLYILCVMI